MVPTGGVPPRPPVHRLAVFGFVTALVAMLLAAYGSMQAEKHISEVFEDGTPSHGSPLRVARGSAGLPAEPGPWWERATVRVETTLFGDQIDRKLLDLTRRSKFANYALQFVAYVLPFLLGLTAAYLGGWAMQAIELSRGARGGNMYAVFSIFIGGLAAVTGGCMIFSVYVWPHLPTAYTS